MARTRAYRNGMWRAIAGASADQKRERRYTMMNRDPSPLRALLVARRFWPLVGGAEKAMGHLAAGLVERGWQVTLLTARWDPTWPEELHFHGAPVIRLPQPAQRRWGTLAYMRAMRRWMIDHRQQFDVACVSMLKHDAAVAVHTLGRHMPVVLRAEGGGISGDCAFHRTATMGWWLRRVCRKADALIAPSPAVADELAGAGFAPERTAVIHNGVPVTPAVDGAARGAARAALAEAHPALQLPPDATLAVYVGRLDAGKGLAELVQAWWVICQSRRGARLWLVGDGTERNRLAEQINRLGLHGRVVLTGTFDRVDEPLAAANLFVLPSHEEGLSLALLEAMMAGLPIVASDIPGNRLAIQPGLTGLLAAPGDAAGLAAAVERLLADAELAARLGGAARSRALAEFTLDQSLCRHQELFARLVRAG